MEHISIEDVSPDERYDAERRGLSEALATSDVAINHYRLAPGERFSGGLHTHMDQEEVFYVVEGEATFELPDDEVTVAASELVRFAPGDYQSGYNDGDEPVVALALGAPKESEDVRIPQECRECGHGNHRVLPGEDGFDFVCPECGNEPDF